jgi:ribosomal protein S18 acetylase RimI-like enzyme
MAIRQLVSEDASNFQSLRLRGLLECPEAFGSSHAEEVDLPLEFIAQRLSPKSDSAVFGSFSGQSLVGLIGIYREARPKLLHKASIWGMYVTPEHRHKGIGRSLVAQALQYASQGLGVRVVNLGVNTQNEAAIALYKAMGFEIYGTEQEFLMLDGVAHDQHLMRRHVHGVA